MNGNIAGRVKAMRKEKIMESKQEKSYWSLQSVAERIGTKAQVLSLIETGKTKKPSAVILHNLAKEFGTSYEYLLFGKEDEVDVISLEIPISRSMLSGSVIKVNLKKTINA